MEQNLDNQWFRDFSGLELTSNTVVLKAKYNVLSLGSLGYKDGMVQFTLECTFTLGIEKKT
ncbi:hypothetical protein OUZ56_010057 [Daphnia magna]|uniref:Uncharacterized protein n=1 Tax=Daphnia magna TaxID=35525 RepID=A0ABR0AHN4_9CRUS|nr:hypothetical protein OUZ56_010057 [Daphnia magna]